MQRAGHGYRGRRISKNVRSGLPSGIKWYEFLRNAENKEQLLDLIIRYVFDEKGQRLIKTPFAITVGDKIHKLQ